MAVVLVGAGQSILEQISCSGVECVDRFIDQSIDILNQRIYSEVSRKQDRVRQINSSTMKLLLISIISLLCLTEVLADETDKISTDSDELDVVELGKDDSDTKTSEAQRKRDSGYSYTRPDRLSSSRYESSGIRGRIVSKYPSSQTVRPFNRYGPPKQTSPQFVKPSDQYAPQHLHIGGHRQQYRPARPQHGSQFGGGQMHQGVPSPIRTYDFVEPSPIASQNNEPFNSNAANYLPPRNQKLPGYSNPNQFSNQQQSTQIHEEHQIQTQNNHQQEQNFNNQQQSQQLLQGQFQDQQQISDAALFLQQNAQAISQLYESPATNLNYEPFHESQGQVDQSQNPNNQFQTFNVNNNPSSQGLQNAAGFSGSLPSYASGFLDNQQTLQQVQSLEKDRLIAQLQQALAQGGNSDSSASSSARYAQNHPTGSYIQSQNLLASIGTQINPSVGPQLDKPNGFNGQRPFGGGNSGFGQGSFLPTTGTTASGLPVTYGLPSTTPATQSPSSTTTATTTTTSPGPQRPPQGATSAGSSQVGTSAPAPTLTFPFPQYGGFVPTLIGTNLLASSYPTYGTNFLGSGSTSITSVQSSGSSPTHFGIPIPTAPSGTQGSSGSSGSTPSSTKPQAPPQQHPHPSTPIHTIPVQPIQPIHPIAATPIHPVFPVAPAVTQVHPVQSPVASGHPTYGLQPAAVNPILIKPVKYPVYYYPNIYQIQKPAVATLPWTYAPAYAPAKPQQIWK